MKNVTISMDDDLAREVRVQAAKAGKSMSRYIAETVEAALRQSSEDGPKRNEQLEAIQRFLSGPKWSMMESGRMPTAEERNERR
ncbi:MAG: hypothetical protein K5872_20240 [Rhizobiaceae bacterium]|nr:hypothetical protein [Rhizobiaceae bacterium]MCV0408549.1 hypothetical protein [Rhizobiaceae bacterium]